MEIFCSLGINHLLTLLGSDFQFSNEQKSYLHEKNYIEFQSNQVRSSFNSFMNASFGLIRFQNLV